MVKQITLHCLAVTAAGVLVPVAAADFLGLSADLVAVNAVQTVPGQPDWPDTWTCRVFAEFDSADALTAIYGDADNYLLFAADSQFYQNAFGGPTSQDIDASQYDDLPDLAYDSWLTIGADSQTDNVLQDIGMSWTAFNQGSPLYANNGAVFVDPTSDQGVAEAQGDGSFRVLIGQFTIFGTVQTKVWGQMNLQWRDATTGDVNASFVEFSFANLPAPGALALLACAAFTPARRRRAAGRRQEVQG